MSADTRTKSGQKARAKTAKRDAKQDAKQGTKQGTKSGTATRAAVRSGAARTPPRRSTTAEVEPEARHGRRRHVLLWSLLGVVVVVGLAVGVALSPILDVESVEVTGVAPDRVAAVQEAAGVAPGDPILALWPSRAATAVEDLPWVEDATVVRDLPGTVRIEVVPRIPVGWTKAGARFLVVDADGTVIEKVDAPPTGVPELTGVADVAPVGGELSPRSLAAAAGAFGPELRTRIASVGLDDGAITAQVVFGPQLRFGTPDRIAVKARVAAAVLASLGATPVTYVDVSVPAAPVSG